MSAFGSISTSTQPVVDEEPPTLQLLAADGDLDQLRLALESKASVADDAINAVDDNGLCPLTSAASYGHADVVAYLLSMGARCDIQDEDGDMPLHSCHNAECARLLLGREDCNPAQANSEGMTAEDMHSQELEQIVLDNTVINVQMNSEGTEAVSTKQEDVEIDEETQADMDRLGLLVAALAEDRERRTSNGVVA
jgi:hypothetical protein